MVDYGDRMVSKGDNLIDYNPDIVYQTKYVYINRTIEHNISVPVYINNITYIDRNVTVENNSIIYQNVTQIEYKTPLWAWITLSIESIILLVFGIIFPLIDILGGR